MVADSSTTESVRTASPTSTAITSRSGGASGAPTPSVNTGGRRCSTALLAEVSTPSETRTTAASGRPAWRSRTAAIAAAQVRAPSVRASCGSPNGASVSPSASVSTANDGFERRARPTAAVLRAASKRVVADGVGRACMLREASTTMATSASLARVGGSEGDRPQQANTRSAHASRAQADERSAARRREAGRAAPRDDQRRHDDGEAEGDRPPGERRGERQAQGDGLRAIER